VCGGGNAQQKFVDAGFGNVSNVEGGTEAWGVGGLPVVRGKKVVSLERQVRIAAGLMFVGITDRCVMGILIAKMAWNQDKGGLCSV